MTNIRTRIAIIKAKAALQRAKAGHFLKHDPEPQTPDLLQTVGIHSLSLLIDGPRHS